MLLSLCAVYLDEACNTVEIKRKQLISLSLSLSQAEQEEENEWVFGDEQMAVDGVGMVDNGGDLV